MSDEDDKFSTQNCQSHMTIVVFGTYCHVIVFLVTTNDNKFRGEKQSLNLGIFSRSEETRFGHTFLSFL